MVEILTWDDAVRLALCPESLELLAHAFVGRTAATASEVLALLEDKPFRQAAYFALELNGHGGYGHGRSHSYGYGHATGGGAGHGQGYGYGYTTGGGAGYGHGYGFGRWDGRSYCYTTRHPCVYGDGHPGRRDGYGYGHAYGYHDDEDARFTAADGNGCAVFIQEYLITHPATGTYQPGPSGLGMQEEWEGL